MKFIVLYIVYPIIWLFSKLPLCILYLFSDVLFFFIYYVFKYRKDVVFKNISKAFPEKTQIEKQKIAKNFFKHFTDLSVESLKSFTMSEKEALKRYQYKNPELLEKYINEGKSIALTGAHQGNWEWSFTLPLILKANFKGAYTSLGNKYFDRFVKRSREKFGFICYKSSNTVKAIHKDYTSKKNAIYLLLSDQSPQFEKAVYWTNFFNVKVPVINGPEALAKRYDLVVINMITRKVKRGYYETEFQLITDNPKAEIEYFITNNYLELTEQNVNNQPELYLWSHNRFKHQHRFEEWTNLKISKKKKLK